jgi:hypothetical protein
MSSHYSKLTLSEVADDLIETLSDLYINAGEYHLQPLLEKLENAQIPSQAKPSTNLISIMERSLEYDPDPLNAAAQELYAQAVVEICKLSSHQGA